MVYTFGPFELDVVKGELRTHGRACALEPQVYTLLTVLVGLDRLVTRDELVAAVWQGREISDAAIASRIRSLRQALGDDGVGQRYIRTVHGRGYRFVAPVRASRPPPSIAVLRFHMLDPAGRHGMLGAAIPHELIAELARLRWLSVSARGSAFRFDARSADPQQVGRLLGVRYCLTGAVEAVGNGMTIVVQLADTTDGGLVWSDRFSGSLDDVHLLRAELCAGILVALDLRIPLHEAERARRIPVPELDSWAAFHLGLHHAYRFTRADNAAAAALFRRAVAVDPGFARAHAGLSFIHFQTAFLRLADDVAAESLQARRSAERAVELDALDPFVNFTMGRSYWLKGDLESALRWLERATGLSPNFAQGLYARGWSETLAGEWEAGRQNVDQAMRLSPLDPLHYAMLGTRALVHLGSGEHAEAAIWGERAARAPGAHVLIAMLAAAAHQVAGGSEKASKWGADVRRRSPGLTRQDFFRSFPVKPPAMRSDLDTALAGLGF